MVGKFGICVANPSRLHHVIGLAKAAKAFGKKVEIFFTGDGVQSTHDLLFSQLLDIGRVSICEVSYISRGYKKEKLPGLVDKDFVTQARNADMVEDCDRYIIL